MSPSPARRSPARLMVCRRTDDPDNPPDLVIAGMSFVEDVTLLSADS